MTDFLLILNAQHGNIKHDVNAAISISDQNIYSDGIVDGMLVTSPITPSITITPDPEHHITNNNLMYPDVKNISIFGCGYICNTSMIYKHLHVTQQTSNPYEIIIHLYITYGIEYTLQMIEGAVSFILIDKRDITNFPKIYIIRDPLGIVPLWTLHANSNVKITNTQNYTHENLIVVSNNNSYIQKILDGRGKNIVYKSHKTTDVMGFSIEPFPAGAHICYSHSNKAQTQWLSKQRYQYYYSLPLVSSSYHVNELPLKQIANTIINKMIFSMNEYIKSIQNDINNNAVCVQLNGDISSALLLAFVHKAGIKNIYTVSCGPHNISWLHRSRDISRFYGTKHIEIVVSNNVIKQDISTCKNTKVEKLLSHIISTHLSSYSDIKQIILPIGSSIWNNDTSSDIFKSDIDARNKIKTMIPRKWCVYVHEYWNKSIKPYAPYIDRVILEKWLSINNSYINKQTIIRQMWDNLYSHPVLNLPAQTKSSAAWEFLHKLSKDEIPICSYIHTYHNTPNSSKYLFC